jgi:hypothetical protein
MTSTLQFTLQLKKIKLGLLGHQRADQKQYRENKEPRYMERYANYKALNARRDRIFHEINNTYIIRPLPHPITPYPGVDRS